MSALPAPKRRRDEAHGDDGAPPNGRALADDPLAGDDVLARFYRPELAPEPRAPAPLAALADKPRAKKQKEKPTHYKLVCISLYNEDIELLERLVAELKRRGHTKANKSQVIRAALDQIDLARIPKGY